MFKSTAYWVVAAGIVLMTPLAVGANAADLESPPPLLGQIDDWTGFHIGGWVGAMCLDTTYLPVGSADPELAGCRVAGGALAGYDMHFDNDMVIGVEGDFGWGGDIASNSLDDVFYSIDEIATLRARLGLARDDTLIYLTAGGAWAQAELTGTFNGVEGEDTQWHAGWSAGVGMEHMVTANLRFRLEYLYSQLGEETYDVTCGCTIEAGIDNLHIARAGLIWGFGFGYELVSKVY
ncbi:MAG TPA: outer membrane beta-barrel protein [Aestuariivirgaceae bacterium]|jgi:opacity protein-like surface antigen